MKKSFSMNIGSTSILLIFIVLALVSFSALSLSSALADQKLTQKSADKVTAYYSASNKAQESLLQIAQDNSSEKSFEFTIPVCDNQYLSVKAQKNDGDKLTVIDYREILMEDAIIFDDALPVFGSSLN